MRGLYADSASPSCVGNFQQYQCDNSSWNLQVHFIPRMLWAISATSSRVSVFRMTQTRLDVRGILGSIRQRKEIGHIFLFSLASTPALGPPFQRSTKAEIRREIGEHLYRTGDCGFSPLSRWDLWSSVKLCSTYSDTSANEDNSFRNHVR